VQQHPLLAVPQSIKKTPFKIMTADDDISIFGKCPSCGCNLDHDKPLCFYCYYRGRVGGAKFLLFKAMKENGNKPVTVDEATKLVNKLRKRHGKPEIGKMAVYMILRRYSENYKYCKEMRSGFLVMVYKEQRRIGKKIVTGRPINKYRLSKKLLNRVDKYERNWILGLPINLRIKRGRFRYHIKYRNNIIMIQQKIKNKEYDIYQYMMI
jgi:hypothetical protein